MLALTDFDQLKALLNLNKDDIEDYPALSAIIVSVYAAIETYTGRSLESAERTETLWLDDDLLVPLRALPIEEVASVTIDGTAVADPVKIIGDGIKLAQRSTGRTDVIYTGGYTAGTIPDALKRAAMLQVQHEFQRKDHVGAESVSNEGGFTKWPQLGLLDEVKRMLNPLRHPAVLI